MLQGMRVPLLSRKASAFGNRLKVAKELCSVEFPSFLPGEQEVRAITRSLAQPCPECSRLVKQRLSAMLVHVGFAQIASTRSTMAR